MSEFADTGMRHLLQKWWLLEKPFRKEVVEKRFRLSLHGYGEPTGCLWA